jgi:hypothetical protein
VGKEGRERKWEKQVSSIHLSEFNYWLVSMSEDGKNSHC